MFAGRVDLAAVEQHVGGDDPRPRRRLDSRTSSQLERVPAALDRLADRRGRASPSGCSCSTPTSATAMMITPRCTIIPPLARPTSPRQPWRRVASTTWRSAEPAAQPPSANASSGAQPAGADDDGDGRARRRRTTPARTAGRAAARRWPCATAAPGRRPSGTAARARSASPAGRSTARRRRCWRSCSASTSSGNTVPSSTTNANTVNSTLLARKAPFARQRRVDRARRAQAVAAPGDQPQRHRDDDRRRTPSR